MADYRESLDLLGDKAPAAEKGEAEAAIADLKKAIEANEPEAIKAKAQSLSQIAMKLGEALYKAQGEAAGAEQPGAEAAAGGAQAGGKPDDGIVDADFEEVKDDKKKK